MAFHINPDASALYGRVKLLKADILSEIPRVLHPKITDHMLLLITFDFSQIKPVIFF